MRRLWGVLLILLVVCQAGRAESNDPNYPKDPNELVRIKWRAVISVLRNKDLDQEAKEKKISIIVNPIFDYPVMAKLALGREHWPKLTPPQQKKFTELFIERLKTSYREKISLYTDEDVLFKPAVRKKNLIEIPMELLSKEKKVTIIHKMRKVGKQWKIYDVDIQGVSILLTYRSQFDDILRRGTVEDLLSRLEKPPTD
ncbi:MAG: ABC transporter substrate-binding protein [Sedimentisphaerales bacterium]|nr:ABC transporter substrate-binding protein [Sedimentisphaerales bacterium]